jgi:hypothetical protein
MVRILMLLAATALGACAGATYSFDGPTIGLANERAARYCGEQDAIARLEDIRPEDGGEVEYYRCVPRAE